MSSPTALERMKPRLLILLLLFSLLLQNAALAQAPARSPASPPASPEDTLLFREGELLLAKGETEKALWRFRRLTTDFPKSPLLHEAKFRMALCYSQLKRPKDAVRILNELLPTFLGQGRMGQVFTLLGDNHLDLKDPLNALHWYGKALLVPGGLIDELKKKVRSVIDGMGTERELSQVESLYRGAYAGGYAKLKLAFSIRRRGDDALARRFFAEIEQEYRGMDFSGRLKEAIEPVRKEPKSTYTIGVILPLSGLHRPFGEKALQGIQLALKEEDPTGNAPSISLAVRDTKGSPIEAERAVEELATKEKAIAILGPLLSGTIERAALKAQLLRIPLIGLSQKEAAGGKADFIFHNSLSPSAQVQALAQYATRETELRTFAAFYPNSPYGVHFKNLFAQEILRRGGRMVGAVVYQEDQTDFSQEIKAFFRVETHAVFNPKDKKQEEYKAGLVIDGLFIPDTYDRAGLILSQLAYYDLKDILFLGTNAWNNPGLLSAAGKSAESSIFVDAFFRGNSSPGARQFVEAFRRAYQRDPETLEALSYDGAKLLREILRAKKVTSSLQLKEEIRQVQNFSGVTNLSGFGEGGKPIRTLTILRVSKGRIEQVQP